MSYTTEHDYNTADTGGGSFELIPADTIARVGLTIRPGGQGEGGWLTQSQSSDAQYLNCEFVITEGEFARRKFWANWTVSGGKVNEKNESIAGNISRDASGHPGKRPQRSTRRRVRRCQAQTPGQRIW